MKIIKKIRNSFIAFVIFIFSIYSKSRAVILTKNAVMEQLSDVPSTYAPPHPSKISILCEILKLLIIPIAITIGLITYYKKSKNNKYKKIVKILIRITILIIAGLVIYYINKVY